MIYAIKINDAAKLELNEAVIWYELQQKGLGSRFIIAFENHLTIIEKNPKLYAKKKKEYREVLIKPFPFLLVYRIEKEKSRVVITAVFHTKRNPKLKHR